MTPRGFAVHRAGQYLLMGDVTWLESCLNPQLLMEGVSKMGGFGGQGPQCQPVLHHSLGDGPWTSTQETHWVYVLHTTGCPHQSWESCQRDGIQENSDAEVSIL